jgi:hypothetical protein
VQPIAGNNDQPEIPHLLQHLWAEYQVHVKETLEKQGKSLLALDNVLKTTSATFFLDWAERYLTEHRPSENLAMYGEVCVRWPDGTTCTVSPMEEQSSGETMDAGAVPVTTGYEKEKPPTFNPRKQK